MTKGAIDLMRLQEDKRHNEETEAQGRQSNKLKKVDIVSGSVGNLVGSFIRGLGTGLLSKFSKANDLAKEKEGLSNLFKQFERKFVRGGKR